VCQFGGSTATKKIRGQAWKLMLHIDAPDFTQQIKFTSLNFTIMFNLTVFLGVFASGKVPP
jgi:hypothetical protein